MREASPFVGRAFERGELLGWLEEAREGRGGLALVSGEAGIGKTRLVKEVVSRVPDPVLAGAGSFGDPSPYRPLTEVLRARLRGASQDPSSLGPLAPYLAILLPELGPPPAAGVDRATLLEAVRGAFAALGREGPAIVLLEDLHWADDATFELLQELGEGLGELPVFLVGTYRSDEAHGRHPLPRLRAELRRRGALREIALQPLAPDETRELAAHVLGAPLSPALAERLHARSQGLPFFVEELADALAAAGELRSGPQGLELPPDGTVPLPDSIRDASLLRTQGLSAAQREALETAAVLGDRFDPSLAAAVLGDGAHALEASFRLGLLLELAPGEAGFRHALVREALYRVIGPPDRGALHRKVAQALDARGAPAELRAAHWLRAGELDAARLALVEAAETSCRLHAYGDAVHSIRRALELWPPGTDEAGRLALLDRMGRCAELSGELDGAIDAWSQVSAARLGAGNLYGFADVQRRLAAVHALVGDWDRALAAHRTAADAFARHGLPEEAASERMAAAEQLEAAGRRREALDLVQTAKAEAARAERVELQALALGFEGQLRAELGELEAGVDAIREALNMALAHDLSPAAAELHYRLAFSLGEAGEYRGASDAWEAGLEYCRTREIHEAERECLACYTGVLMEMGEWDRASAICTDLREDSEPGSIVRIVACAVLGLLGGLQGRPEPARRSLLEAEDGLRGLPPLLPLDLTILWAHAVVDEGEGRPDAAAERIRLLRKRWAQTDDLYSVIHPLRWGATFLAGRGLDADTRACADILASVTAAKGSSEALAALAHCLGECALLDGEPERAAKHFLKALDLLARLALPFQQAQTRIRTAAALAASGDREGAARHLAEAYRAAHRMGARPLADRAVQGLRELGEPLARRLGRRAAHRIRHGGLTPREVQVLRLVNRGRSNRAIARELFLSPRTVEMHVSNALLKLECANRTEAAHRARELGVLA